MFDLDLYEHEDYLRQLLNDAPVTQFDRYNNETISWNRINTDIPNDVRDTKRYNCAAMVAATGNGEVRSRAAMREERTAEGNVINAGMTALDGSE